MLTGVDLSSSCGYSKSGPASESYTGIQVTIKVRKGAYNHAHTAVVQLSDFKGS